MVFFKFLDKKTEEVKEAAQKAEEVVAQANTPVVELEEKKEEPVVKLEIDNTALQQVVITTPITVETNTVEVKSEAAEGAEKIEEDKSEEVVTENVEEVEKVTEEVQEPENNETAEVVGLKTSEELQGDICATLEEPIEETTITNESIEAEPVENEEQHVENTVVENEVVNEKEDIKDDTSKISLSDLRDIIVDAVDFVFDKILSLVELETTDDEE